MNPDPQKLQHRQTEQTVESQQSQQQSAAREFGSVEEMLRYDAAHTEVPATLKPRLADSLAKEPVLPPRSPWWRRWLGT